MTSAFRSWWLPSLGLALGVLTLAGSSMAADRPKADPQPAATVEMFAAIQSGQIAVRFIPKDSTQARVLIENKTRQPLTVKLPEAFAATPVLAQLGGAIGGGGRNVGGVGGGGVSGTGGGQSVGGGMGGMGGGMGGRGGGGFFNVAPEKVGQLRVETVCLEHGKPEPNAHMSYEIRPIEQFTDKASVQQVCRLLGEGTINQRVAQAAAWHLQNNMTWQQLAAKEIRHLNGARQPWFSPQEIQAGMAAVSMANQLVAKSEKASPADSNQSLNKP